MTIWRVSVDQRDGTTADIVVDASHEATVSELQHELAAKDLAPDQLLFDGQEVAVDTLLEQSSLRHGSRISSVQPDRLLGPGWYLVSVAGPDTGIWAGITRDGISVGRSESASLTVVDSSLSAKHFTVTFAEGDILVKDVASTNGTVVEGERIDGQVQVSDGTYISAGASVFGILHVDDASIAPASAKIGATVPFQRRFREAMNPLPASLQHPTPPGEKSAASRRSLISYIIPLLSSLGIGVAMAVTRWPPSDGFNPYLMMPILTGVGSLFMVIDGLRRRRIEAREQAERSGAYETDRAAFVADLERARREERDRDRWAATPAGVASILTRIRHSRIWERSASDDDFCEVAIGLHNCASRVEVVGRPDDEVLPFDEHWAAVLRHNLVREGSLAVLGPAARTRATARSLLLDLATSHSPHDVKIWLITDADSSAPVVWNDLRWLPHTFMGQAQNYIFATAPQRGAALSTLRSIINERKAVDRREGLLLPVHVVVVDCVERIEHEELTDLLTEGAPVGVIGIVLDEVVTPEGTNAQLTIGEFADEAAFVSETQARARFVRSFEMTSDCLGAATRSMAAYRPAGSSREVDDNAGTLRLVDLIEAEIDLSGVEGVIARWRLGGSPRVRIGGLGDAITEIDIMKDGPHGLVGGTTRSGKTEFLKSLITALAVNNHPNDLSIVIVDFKGGVDHELSALLPHVIDLSTNHNVDSFVRTVRLIEAELERRQRQFKTAGTPNFDAYQSAADANPVLLPMPRLLIIVDEFSELLSSEAGKANLPALEGITRVGGGLGVHLLLVTQNFESQLPSQIAANAGLRICFRVQEVSHSKAVLNSPEAATIPKERIGRAFLRSHGGRVIEFQGARVAGPRPGRETQTAAVGIRAVPFTALADAGPRADAPDVPATDTDMYAVVRVLQEAAARTGWQSSVVPWPRELPRDLSIGALRGVETDWPLGLIDEPERQRQMPVGLAADGSHTLLLGGGDAHLGEIVRAAVTCRLIRQSPEYLHVYVIDQLGQGLSSLQAFPHVGGVAERNEAMSMRILRLVAAEVGRRKSLLAETGAASISELARTTGETLPEIVLVIHGADRLLMHGEAQPTPVLGPLLSLLPESVGTGVRVLMSGASSVAHHRLGASIAHRFVFRCPDPHEYPALGVPRHLFGTLNDLGRAVDVGSGHLVQFATVPSGPECSATDVIRALGYRVTEMWQATEGSPQLPVALRDLPWPLPIRHVTSTAPPREVDQPVTMSMNAETCELSWLDAEEDGPAFYVCGPPKSGRSNALIAAASLMAQNGWQVVGLPLSRRSPMTADSFPGAIVTAAELGKMPSLPEPTALLIDDAHKWVSDVDQLQAWLGTPGQRAIIAAGPTEFFAGRNELLRLLSARCALVLSPQSGMDASQFGVRRLNDEVLRDMRPGRGVLVVSGESVVAQVPLAI